MRSVSVSEMSGLSSGCQRSLHLIRDSSLCFVSLALPDSARLVKCSSKQIPAEHWGGGGGDMTRSDQDIAAARLPFFASENKPSGALISIRRPCRHKSHKNPNDFIHLNTALEPNKSSAAESLQSRRLWPRTFRMGATQGRELHCSSYRDALTLPVSPE